MKVEVENLTYITAELDSGNICPACPKVSWCCGFMECWVKRGGCSVLQLTLLVIFSPHLFVLRKLEVLLFQWMPSLDFHERSLPDRATKTHSTVTFSSKINILLMNTLLPLHNETEQIG